MKKKINKIANSFYSDLQKDLTKKKFKKNFYSELLGLQIADEIIKLRKSKGLTQKDLAHKIKTTQAVISRIENAQVYPSTNIIQRICNSLAVEATFRFCEIK